MITHIEFAMLMSVRDEFKTERQIREELKQSEGLNPRLNKLVKKKMCEWSLTPQYVVRLDNKGRHTFVKAFKSTKLGKEELNRVIDFYKEYIHESEAIASGCTIA